MHIYMSEQNTCQDLPPTWQHSSDCNLLRSPLPHNPSPKPAGPPQLPARPKPVCTYFCTLQLLYDTFSAFGMVIATPKIMRDPDTGASKGFGFVSFDGFEASDGAIEAMNGQYLCNRSAPCPFMLHLCLLSHIVTSACDQSSFRNAVPNAELSSPL